jgi:gamma-glutamyltranspeptidase / glutathione hydrolase
MAALGANAALAALALLATVCLMACVAPTVLAPTPASTPTPTPASATATATQPAPATSFSGPTQPGFAQPEGASAWTPKPGWTAQRFMVAAANPLATDAGYEILRAGGSALDAAIAVQLVLTLVEPQSSGIGGGAFLMHTDGRGGDASVQAWDGRETAPAAADPKLFLGADGKPVPYAQAVFGGRAVATPGVLKMLHAAHQQQGQLPWARLFEGAIVLAEQGFAVSPRLHGLLAADPALRRDVLAHAFFYEAGGQALPIGHVLRNPALAAIYRQVAQQGPAAFYGGAIATDLVTRVQQHSVPGRLSLADMAAYQPVQRAPMCTDWTVAYRVCGFPPPSSGHIAIMQSLGLLALLPETLKAPPLHANASAPTGAALAATPAATSATPTATPTAAWLHTYIEASRLAYADRALYVADPAFVSAPGGDWHNLLATAYLAKRVSLIGAQSMKTVSAGDPGAMLSAYAPMPEQVEHGTSHISVVDAQGRAVAMTTSIEAGFGARVMADGGTGLPGGYLLNNQMSDFAWSPTDAQGRPVANRIEPGKRPRSSMSPTLVFERRASAGGDAAAVAPGRFLMTLGSPGGPVIIHFTAKTLLASLQWGLHPQAAIDVPNFAHIGGPVLLESGRFSAADVAALKARGHAVVETELPSGLQAIQRTPAGWRGGADLRREGIARGD